MSERERERERNEPRVTDRAVKLLICVRALSLHLLDEQSTSLVQLLRAFYFAKKRKGKIALYGH